MWMCDYVLRISVCMDTPMEGIDFTTILIREGIALHNKICNMDNVTCHKNYNMLQVLG